MRITLAAALAGCAGGCSFETSLTPSDAMRPDVVDGPAGLPTSCRALHEAMPALPDTDYVIDPDGDGAEAQHMVSCDMTTADGGWTIIFTANNANLSTLSTYEYLSPKLMMDATEVLIAYRDLDHKATANFATFAIPEPWRTAAPFGYSGTDVSTMVRVNGGAPIATTLRYGLDNFDTLCTDSWNTTTKLGRICLVGTAAPFFNGFYSQIQDHCGDSLGSWSSVNCTNSLRFSIAVR